MQPQSNERADLDWRGARVVDEPRPCVLCGKPTILLSPAKGAPCHKRCAEDWLQHREPHSYSAVSWQHATNYKHTSDGR